MKARVVLKQSSGKRIAFEISIRC